MARKRGKEEKPMETATPEAEAVKAVRLELPVDEHKRLRVAAAQRDQSMAALVRGLVEEFLAKESAKK